jgi:protein-S-isoprenylcysteine O-methyltransferase Ste14
MPVQLKVIILVAASAPLAWLSRSSLRDPSSHGFHRFFAWEAMLAVIVLNLGYWFHAPFSRNQIASWLLLIVSGFLVVHGVRSLRMGKPDSTRDDPSLIGIEKTTELVTVGACRYIRHPIYSAGLFLVWGACCKHLSLVTVSVAAIATVFLTATARKEETENVRFFGGAYQSYMTKTKMFIPFLF